MKKTFPFEVRATKPTSRIVTVDAFATAHPLLVVHKTLLWDEWHGAWTLSHGPTSRVWARCASFEEAQKRASFVAQLDPDGSTLEFCDEAAGHCNPPDEVRALRAEAERIHAEQAQWAGE